MISWQLSFEKHLDMKKIYEILENGITEDEQK